MSNRIREKFLLSRAELDAIADGPGQNGSDIMEVQVGCGELANRIDRVDGSPLTGRDGKNTPT